MRGGDALSQLAQSRTRQTRILVRHGAVRHIGGQSPPSPRADQCGLRPRLVPGDHSLHPRMVVPPRVGLRTGVRAVAGPDPDWISTA